MPVDQREQLWEAVYDTYYEAYFQELFADDLVTIWRKIDEITKVCVAITATSSVVSGWVLWQTPTGYITWVVIAGIVAVLSIVHATLGVPAKLKDWGEVKQIYTALRVDLETLRHQMKIDTEFQLDEFKQKFINYRDRYRDGMQRIQNDMFRTLRRANKIQSSLNERLADLIIEE